MTALFASPVNKFLFFFYGATMFSPNFAIRALKFNPTNHDDYDDDHDD